MLGGGEGGISHVCGCVFLTWSTWKKDVCPGSQPVGPGGTITSIGATDPTRAGAGTRWSSITSRMAPSSPFVKMKPTFPTTLGRSCAKGGKESPVRRRRQEGGERRGHETHIKRAMILYRYRLKKETRSARRLREAGCQHGMTQHEAIFYDARAVVSQSHR